MIINSDA